MDILRLAHMKTNIICDINCLKMPHREAGFFKNYCPLTWQRTKSRYNTVLSPHCVNRAIDRIIKACNAKEKEEAKAEGRGPELLPHFSCHHLRHTFCTRFCENETNLKVIQEIMGYADITTTMDIYNEATKDKKMESFAWLEGEIKMRWKKGAYHKTVIGSLISV